MFGHAKGMVVCLLPMIRCGFCLRSPGLLTPTLMSRLSFPPSTLEPLLLHRPDLPLPMASVPSASAQTLRCHGGLLRTPDLNKHSQRFTFSFLLWSVSHFSGTVTTCLRVEKAGRKVVAHGSSLWLAGSVVSWPVMRQSIIVELLPHLWEAGSQAERSPGPDGTPRAPCSVICFSS